MSATHHDPTTRLIEILETRGYNPRPTGPDAWESKCPGHDGRRHNLCISRGNNGKALVCCHHEPPCTADAIVEALGLTVGDLFPANGLNGHAGGNGKPRADKVHKTIDEAVEKNRYGKGATKATRWIYQAEDGKPLMAVGRFDLPNGDKTYQPFHPVEGGWRSGDPKGLLPLFALPMLHDARRAYFAEGEKGAVRLHDLGLVGTTTAHGAKSPQKSDFTPLAGKEIVILPDHDDEGEDYATHVAALLASLDPRPTVKIVRLPLTGKGDDIAEWLSDVVPKEWSRDDCRAELERLADAAALVDIDATVAAIASKTEEKNAKAKPKSKKPRNTGDDGLYFEEAGALFIVGEDGPETLCNFTARITHNITRHEAGVQSVRYQILAQHQDAAIGEREITVTSDRYPAMSWVFAMGAEFAISAGRDRKDHARCAIQTLSKQDGIESIVEYTSLGWVRHGEAWLYLHANGAIAADGATNAVRVELPPALSRYRLPEPPIAGITMNAIGATLEVWELAKGGTPAARGIAAIVATLPWRAVLSPFNSSPHLGGPSGSLKTSVAQLILQFFAADVIGRGAPTPAGWNDTKNSLQRLSYDCACSVLLVDDLKTLAQAEVAEAVLQAQGNLQNRNRMGMDQSLQRSLDPRGTIASTGEIDCRSASTLGRMLMIEVRRGDVDRGVLAKLQHYGDIGLFATAMSAYIQWLAPRLDKIRKDHARYAAEFREELEGIDGVHPRHPQAITELLVAYRIYLQFAMEVGAIEKITADAYGSTAIQYLIELMRAQADPQAEAKPGRRFLDLIGSALRSKRCHLARVDGDDVPAQYAGACGWHRDWLYQGNDTGQMLDWRIPANSKLIGFVDEDAGLVYLDDTEVIAVANEQGRRHHTPQSFAAIGRELLNEGLCRSHADGAKRRATADKRIPNHGKKRYFWVAIPHLFGDAEVVE